MQTLDLTGTRQSLYVKKKELEVILVRALKEKLPQLSASLICPTPCIPISFTEMAGETFLIRLACIVLFIREVVNQQVCSFGQEWQSCLVFRFGRGECGL